MEKPHRAKAKEPTGKKAIHLKEKILPFFRLCGHHIAEARYHRIKNNIYKISNISDDVDIVVHNSRGIYIDKRRYNDLIRLQPGHVTDFVANQRLRLGGHHLRLLRRQLLHILIPQIRIKPVQIGRHKYFL